MPKFDTLKMARGLNQVFRPVEITDIDDNYHCFIVRYSGDYISHSHESDEFVHILEGSLLVEIDGHTEEVRQGMSILIPAGCKHRPKCGNMALGLVFEKKGVQKQMDPQV